MQAQIPCCSFRSKAPDAAVTNCLLWARLASHWLDTDSRQSTGASNHAWTAQHICSCQVKQARISFRISAGLPQPRWLPWPNNHMYMSAFSRGYDQPRKLSLSFVWESRKTAGVVLWSTRSTGVFPVAMPFVSLFCLGASQASPLTDIQTGLQAAYLPHLMGSVLSVLLLRRQCCRGCGLVRSSEWRRWRCPARGGKCIPCPIFDCWYAVVNVACCGPGASARGRLVVEIQADLSENMCNDGSSHRRDT